MRTRLRINESKRAGQKGNALIEFAICSVLLMLMTCGIVDFGRVLTDANCAFAAAAAGTTYGALSPAHYDQTGMQNAAIADTGNAPGVTANATQFCTCSIGGAPATCPADCSGGGSPETYIQVTVTVPFHAVIAYPWVPDPINVTGVSTVRVQ
jgi:Flp pilus assembly protein TadG